MNSLKQRTIAGLGWNFANQFVVQLIALVIGIVLSRLLGPSQFGLIMMVTVITQFAHVFASMGFASALIQKKEIDENDRSTVFWVNLAMGILIAITITLCAPMIAWFYGKPILASISVFVSINFVLTALNMVQRSLLEREMAFKKLFAVNTIASFGAGVVAISLAFFGWGVWSLVTQLLLRTSLQTALLWFVSSWYPTFAFSKESLFAVSKFGFPLLGSNSFNYWTRNADNLLIGKFWGDIPLGFYDKSYRLMLLPVTNFSRVLAKVMFPSMSKIQNQPEKVKSVYLKLVGVTALVSFPIAIGMSLLSEPLILVMYGPKWVGSIELLRILSLLGLNQSVCSLNGIVFTARGATMLQLKWGLISKPLVIGATLLGLPYGAYGVAVTYTLASFLITIPSWLVIGRVIPVSVSEILEECKGPFFCSLVMASVVVLLLQLAIKNHNSVMQLSVCFVVGAIVYAVLAYISKLRPVEEILNLASGFTRSNSIIK